MRNSKRLVQVQVTNVSADVSGAAEPDLSVHVSAVHVYLTAVPVDGITNVRDGLLKHAVRGRIGDHQSRQIISSSCSLNI